MSEPKAQPNSPSFASEFSITLGYQPGEGSPSRLFFALGDLIESFQQLDETLAKGLVGEVEPLVVLDGVCAEPFRIRLHQRLESDGEFENEALGKAASYLMSCRRAVLGFIASNDQVTEPKLRELETQLMELAAKPHGKRDMFKRCAVRRALLESMRSLSQALVPLEPGDNAFYSEDGMTIPLNPKFSISENTVHALTTIDKRSVRSRMPLKVRRANFIGEAKWQFQIGEVSHDVVMGDRSWLASYQKGEIKLLPGDSIQADVLMETEYCHDVEADRTSYTILKVVDVVSHTKPIQQPLYGFHEERKMVRKD
ncbi:hypothetical protein EON80_14830 [bacterium]|nr:MAG: hypothetical protein EON80_14830 [bacterium]